MTTVPELGGKAPAFEALVGVDGARYSLTSFADRRLLVLVFSCNGCPTVKAAEDRLIAIQHTYQEGGVQLLAINSNNHYLSPADSYPEMVARAEAKAFNFPYLQDEQGMVARSYGAARTPHAFLLDEERRVRYRGRIQDSRDPAKVTRRDLENALDDLLAGRVVLVAETEPLGCAIVW